MALVEDLIDAYREAEAVSGRLTRAAVRDRELKVLSRLLQLSSRDTQGKPTNALSERDQLLLYRQRDHLVSCRRLLPSPERWATKTPHAVAFVFGVVAPGVLVKLNFKAEAAVILAAFVVLSGLRGVIELRARRLLGIPGEKTIGPRIRRNRRARSTNAYTIELRLLHTLGLQPFRERPREFIFLGFLLILVALTGLSAIAFDRGVFGDAPIDETALDVGIGICTLAGLGVLRLAWVAAYRVVARRRLWRSIVEATSDPRARAESPSAVSAV